MLKSVSNICPAMTWYPPREMTSPKVNPVRGNLITLHPPMVPKGWGGRTLQLWGGFSTNVTRFGPRVAFSTRNEYCLNMGGVIRAQPHETAVTLFYTDQALLTEVNT